MGIYLNTWRESAEIITGSFDNFTFIKFDIRYERAVFPDAVGPDRTSTLGMLIPCVIVYSSLLRR